MSAPATRILEGDCRQLLAELPAEYFHTVVTSPPYWGLRDYDEDGQIGLEQTPEEYLCELVGVFDQVRRLLRPDGTVWLNMGDSYAGSGKGGAGSFMLERGDSSWKGKATLKGWAAPPDGFKRKDLLGMPWRLALALQDAGWWLRADIIWEKPNCMPEAVDDRPTKSHEYLFLLARSPTYYYDADAIREGVSGGSHTRGGGVGGKAVPPGKGPQGRIRQNEDYGHAIRELVTSRNRRSVWSIPTQAYSGEHFATFPEQLVRPCILAGTSAAGCCSACGMPLRRDVEITGPTFQDLTVGREPSTYARASLGNPHSFAVRGSHGHVARVRRTVGWLPGCECGAPTEPCRVLDPFTGSGTTGAVAIRHGRHFVGLELNPAYAQQARARVLEAAELAGRVSVRELDVIEPDRHVQLGLLADE